MPHLRGPGPGIPGLPPGLPSAPPRGLSGPPPGLPSPLSPKGIAPKDAQAIASDAALKALGAVQLKQMLRDPPTKKGGDTSSNLIAGNIGPIDQALLLASLQGPGQPQPTPLGAPSPLSPLGSGGLPPGPGIPTGPSPVGIPAALGIGPGSPIQLAAAAGPPPNPIDLILNNLARNQTPVA